MTYPSWRDQAAIYVPAPAVPDKTDYAETLEHAGERTAQGDGSLIAAPEWADAVAEAERRWPRG